MESGPTSGRGDVLALAAAQLADGNLRAQSQQINQLAFSVPVFEEAQSGG